MASKLPVLGPATHRCMQSSSTPTRPQSSTASRRQSKQPRLLLGALTMKSPEGESRKFDQATVTIGSSSTADICIEGPNMASEHAQLAQRSGRTFCTALLGDEEDLHSSTYTWLNGNQIRKGVAYVVTPQSEIAFGEPTKVYVVDFAESGGSDAMFETLLKGMAASASDDVKKQVMDSLDK